MFDLTSFAFVVCSWYEYNTNTININIIIYVRTRTFLPLHSETLGRTLGACVVITDWRSSRSYGDESNQVEQHQHQHLRSYFRCFVACWCLHDPKRRWEHSSSEVWSAQCSVFIAAPKTEREDRGFILRRVCACLISFPQKQNPRNGDSWYYHRICSTRFVQIPRTQLTVKVFMIRGAEH